MVRAHAENNPDQRHYQIIRLQGKQWYYALLILGTRLSK